MANKGYEFERETGDSLKRIPGAYVHKLVDTHAFTFCPSCEHPLNITLPKQPSDFLVVKDGKATFIECKSSRNPISYNISYIAVHQVEDALEVMKAGAQYYFVICMRKPHAMAAYVVTPQDIIDIIATMTTKAAVRWPEISKRGKSLDRDMKDRVWLGWEEILK